MKITPTPLEGAYVIESPTFPDERGYFSFFFNETNFSEKGLNTQWVQTNKAFNHQAGTLRGMHFQNVPHAEVKLITCVLGRIFDVIVDIRPDSPTKNQWFGVELSGDNHKALYVPEGFAHGYQTLESDSLVIYQVSNHYHPQASGGLMWDDPALNIQWPKASQRQLSDRDKQWGYLNSAS